MKSVEESDFNGQIKFIVTHKKVFTDKKYMKEANLVAKNSLIAKKKSFTKNKDLLSFMITERRKRMDKPMLESRLKLYKQHNAEVETTLKRIEVWKEMLDKGELEYFEDVSESIPGMPRSMTVTSPVEKITVRNEVAAETVEQWIRDDESRILYKRLEIEQIQIAIDALTSEQEFVIEAKYFKGMNWRNIEIVYNQKFSGNRVFLTEGRLKQINNDALEILWAILEPLYNKYLYFKQYNLELKQAAARRSEQIKTRRKLAKN